MPDLSRALTVLRSMRTSMSPEIFPRGTSGEAGNTLDIKSVPVVPSVPRPNDAPLRSYEEVCPHDVLERAAILEFCAGLPRKEAEALALAEFCCTTLSPGLADLTDLEDKP